LIIYLQQQNSHPTALSYPCSYQLLNNCNKKKFGPASLPMCNIKKITFKKVKKFGEWFLIFIVSNFIII